MSGLFSFTTGDDEDSPVLMSVANEGDEAGVYSQNITLTSMSRFLVEFNEEISVVSNGHIHFLDENDGSIVTVTTYHNDSNSSPFGDRYCECSSAFEQSVSDAC